MRLWAPSGKGWCFFFSASSRACQVQKVLSEKNMCWKKRKLIKEKRRQEKAQEAFGGRWSEHSVENLLKIRKPLRGVKLVCAHRWEGKNEKLPTLQLYLLSFSRGNFFVPQNFRLYSPYKTVNCTFFIYMHCEFSQFIQYLKSLYNELEFNPRGLHMSQ